MATLQPSFTVLFILKFVMRRTFTYLNISLTSLAAFLSYFFIFYFFWDTGKEYAVMRRDFTIMSIVITFMTLCVYAMCALTATVKVYSGSLQILFADKLSSSFVSFFFFFLYLS